MLDCKFQYVVVFHVLKLGLIYSVNKYAIACCPAKIIAVRKFAIVVIVRHVRYEFNKARTPALVIILFIIQNATVRKTKKRCHVTPVIFTNIHVVGLVQGSIAVVYMIAIAGKLVSF